MVIASMKSRMHGFSLVELVVVMAVLSILMGQGLPAVADYLDNASVRRAAVELQHAALMARSESVKRNVRTELRVSATGWEIYDVTALPQARLLSGMLDPRAQATTVTIGFASNGRTFPAGAATRIDVALGGVACALNARCMAVAIASGGMSKVCDPAKSTGAAGACA